MSTTEGTLHNRISSFIQAHSIDLSKGVVVGFSGGADSLALLSLLSSIAPANCVQAVYVNHNLREEGELEREIALEELKGIKNDVKQDLSPYNWVSTAISAAKKFGMLYLVRKVVK